MTTALDEVRTWINQRRRGGSTPAEAFTVGEASRALPRWSYSSVWRAVMHLLDSGQLRRVAAERPFRYTPTRSWRSR